MVQVNSISSDTNVGPLWDGTFSVWTPGSTTYGSSASFLTMTPNTFFGGHCWFTGAGIIWFGGSWIMVVNVHFNLTGRVVFEGQLNNPTNPIGRYNQLVTDGTQFLDVEAYSL